MSPPPQPQRPDAFDLADLVEPLIAEVQALIPTAHDLCARLDLVGVSHALSQVIETGADLRTVGQRSAAVLVAQIESIDREVARLEAHGIDWSLIRRHLLLVSRRRRLVALTVQLEDLAHTLLD